MLGRQEGRLVLMQRFAAGFTLIELMIGIAIAALLLTLAVPAYQDFMVNTQIRTVTESIANGLRTAQAQAIKRNTNVEFILEPNAASANWGWDVFDPATATTLQQYRFVAGGQHAAVTVALPSAAERMVTFNGIGRILAVNPDATQPMDEIRVTSPSSAQARPLRVLTGFNSTADPTRASGIKVCNPLVPVGDPQACP
jgi:type IV fimbrial biogenesis protein FimT